MGADDFGNRWAIFTAMQGNPALMDAVDVVGVHYPCGYLGNSATCPSPQPAQQSGKTLWASEEGSQDYNTGAGHLAKGINRVYIDGKMTALINWSLIWSAYANLPFSGAGLMLADTPWSGYYAVGKDIWVFAHTTQFAQAGWSYIDGACGYLRGDQNVGSYVARRSPSGHDYSLVAETVDATAAEPVTIKLSGDLAAGPRARLAHQSELEQFRRLFCPAARLATDQLHIFADLEKRQPLHVHKHHRSGQGNRYSAHR